MKKELDWAFIQVARSAFRWAFIQAVRNDGRKRWTPAEKKNYEEKIKMAAGGAGRQQGEAAEPRKRGENEDGKEGEKERGMEATAGPGRPAGGRKEGGDGRKEGEKKKT